LWTVIVTGFIVEGMRIAATRPEWAIWSPAGLLTAKLMGGVDESLLMAGHGFMWWFHLALSFLFLAAIPYSKLMHMVAGAANHVTKKLEPRWKLSTPDLEEAETFGAAKPAELAGRGLLDSLACMACGRCDEACPASATGKPLYPRKIMLSIRGMENKPDAYLIKSEEDESKGAPPISDEELWACTNCMACHAVCPSFIEPIDMIVEMRRYLSMSEGRYPKEVTTFFKNEETNSNPWGLGWEKRADWVKELGLTVPIAAEKREFEYLYWVGCAGSYDGRYKKVSAAFTRLLNAAGVDYAILGNEEKCNGDPLRRLGNEYLFQMLASENVENFKKYGVKKIVTPCPHCYNVFKNDYRDFGFEGEVIHHSQMIGSLIAEGRLPKPESEPSGGRVVYHDSCYIGRYNGIYDEPRALVGENLAEPPRTRDDSFCCGAGGGRMWMEETLGERINFTRADELLGENPSTIATTCPFCMTMLTDGVKQRGKLEDVPVKDIAEILADRLPQ